ncbi:ATP-binding protein [Cupriavidus basilensis]|uniref:histidine kinase n=1 Tax=Cupriavidus basilensis TaxID=68895 RepID=A0ABT6AQ96_9BURK|nr:ATP-binding protein [Cupriavidus basilensis]MDF3834775.1 ATP-binding protein [Cupriavidus basilensis]
MNALIGATQPDGAGLRAALDLARAQSDATLEAAIKRLQESSCDDCKRDAALMRSARERLQLARQDIDRLAAMPREERSTRAADHAISRMFRFIEDMNLVTDRIILELIRDEPSVAEHVLVARLAAELREQAGRAGSLFTPALMSRKALSADEMERLWLVIGRIHALGDLIGRGTLRHPVAVTQMQRIYFDGGIAYLRQTARAGSKEAMMPTAASFAQHYVPLMRPITALRDAELDAAIRYVDERKNSTRNALGLLAAVVVTIILSIVSVLVLFSRRIIEPISAATVSILSFASGNYSTPAYSFRWKDQIGALLDALQALRDAMVRNGQLESERSTLVERLREAVSDSQVQAGLLEEARDAAVASSEAKGRFLAMMSHEIRTPMHGLLGLLEALRRTILDAQQRHYLDVADSSAKALMQILNDILEYSMVDAGTLAMMPAPTDLREVVDEVMAALAGSGESKGLEMAVYVHPGVAATYLADAYRLRQVLLSLLSNAIKFTSQGRVGISVSLGKVDGTRQQVVLTVYDTGIGISETAQKGLFLPFEQSQGTLTRRFGGVGIGLAISKRLVEMMGGTVEIASAEHLGTSVIIRIDLTAEREQYDFPEFKGRVILIGTEMINVTKSLRAFALAAGMEPIEGRLWPRDRGMPTLYVRDAEGGMPGWPGHAMLVGRLDSVRPEGVSELPNYWANPPNWSLFVAACQEAIAQNASEDGAGSGFAEPSLDWAAMGPVVVADDSPVNCLVLTNQLRQLGCEAVLTCSHGEEAWSVLSTTRVALLITDVYMPKLDGIELILRVRAAELASNHRTRIVAITASVLKETEQRCRDAGAEVFLTKPVSVNQLRSALAQMYGAK